MDNSNKIQITNDQKLLARHGGDDYAHAHAGNEYTVSEFDSEGWAIIAGAKFHPCCFTKSIAKIETTEYTLPVYWASYLINGDGSGFDIANTPDNPEAGDKERAEIAAWVESEGNPYFVDCGEPYFAHRNDANTLGGDVATYTAHVRN